MKRNTLIFIAVLLILAAASLAGWTNWKFRTQPAQRPPAPQLNLVSGPAEAEPQYVSALQGKPAPAFTLEDINGKKVSLADYKGKALLLDFWATWCTPCRIETPWLIDLRNQYAAQGFEILAISADDLDRGDPAKLSGEKREIARFVQKMQIPYPVLLDADSISKPYGGLDQLPTSFFVDRNGVIVAAQMGLTSKGEIETNIRKALGI